MDSGMHKNVAPFETNTEGGIASSGISLVKKTRRGPSQGPIRLPEGQKRLIKTNSLGLPNLIDENTKALSSDIGLQVRELLPVAFDEFDKLPEKSFERVLEVLQEIYNLRYVSIVWLDKKIRKAWRGRKYHLRQKYIKGKDGGALKAGDTPDFVTIEDWHAFIDISTTPEFLASSARNSANRGKLDMPNGSGRHSMAQIRHRIATQKNFSSDDDVGRAEGYIEMLSKKRKPDYEKIVFGKDTRTRMRNMGEGVSSKSIRDSTHLVNKVIDAEQQNAENESLLHKLSKDMEVFKKFVTTELLKTGKEKNIRSPESIGLTTSSQRTNEGATDIGKKCDVHAWNKNLVARGEVVEVDPKTIAHNVAIGEGNYKILIETVIDSEALLFRPNSQVQMIAEVCGGYAVWPKQSLTIYE